MPACFIAGCYVDNCGLPHLRILLVDPLLWFKGLKFQFVRGLSLGLKISGFGGRSEVRPESG